MRVIGFGDSFTAGEGTDNQYVEQLSTFEKIEKYQKEHSWPRYLADKIGVKYVNNGEVGSSNYRIFSNIFEQFAYNNINNDDLVVIMWSSPLRDPLPFFPHMFSRTSPIGLSWSMKEFMSQDTQEWKNRYYEHYGKTEKSEIKYIENDLLKFMEEYFPFYVENLHNEGYYKQLNTNYIVLLQKYLESKGVDYIMCDAFEQLSYDKELVDTTNYYNHQTTYEFLVKNGGDVFETGTLFPKSRTKHPNTTGHELIAEELFRFYESIYRIR